MTYLLRHPKTSVYYFRRAVPPELRAAIGRREWKESLRTTDVRKAKTLALEVGQRVQASFEKATKELAGEVAYPLRQIDVLMVQGRTAALVCKEAEISEQSYYR
jgi:hypothetical protein